MTKMFGMIIGLHKLKKHYCYYGIMETLINGITVTKYFFKKNIKFCITNSVVTLDP